MEKKRLTSVAVLAGILLMIFALLCFFALRITEGIFDPFEVITALLILPAGFLLLFRKRFLAIGILLCVLSSLSFAAMLYWANFNARLPVFLAYGARSVVFLAAALVCFRRLRSGKRGAWWLGPAAGILFCIYLLHNGVELSQTGIIGDSLPGQYCLLLGSADQLLYISLFLTALAFARPLADPSEPVPGPAPVRTERKETPAADQAAEQKPQPVPPAPKPQAYAEAEYEILPEEDGQ